MASPTPTRDELAERYLAQLPYAPYPVQEDALLAWFTAEQGVLVCSHRHRQNAHRPGRPLRGAAHRHRRLLHHAAHRPDRAEVPGDAGVRRALGLSTPTTSASSPAIAASIPTPAFSSSSPRFCSIALLHAAPRAGLCPTTCRSDRRRSISRTSRPWSWTSSTTSPIRSAASSGNWRSLCCRRMCGCCCCRLRSATPASFSTGCDHCHQRKLELVEGKERKVPLTFRWVPDEFLGDQLVHMAKGEGDNRTTPASGLLLQPR